MSFALALRLELYVRFVQFSEDLDVI